VVHFVRGDIVSERYPTAKPILTKSKLLKSGTKNAVPEEDFKIMIKSTHTHIDSATVAYSLTVSAVLLRKTTLRVPTFLSVHSRAQRVANGCAVCTLARLYNNSIILKSSKMQR